MKVAALQTSSTPDPGKNLATLTSLIAQAAEQGSKLLVLPEASQRSFGDNSEPLAPDAEALDGTFVTSLIRLAEEYRVTIVGGLFEVSEDSLRPYNTTVMVDHSGIISRYRKIHLYDAFGYQESTGVTPGVLDEDNVCVVQLGGMNVGIMTCFDLRFPEMAEWLVERGAEVLVLGAAWVAGERKIDQWNTLLSARAIETGCFVVAAAQSAPRYSGNSQILSPNGSKLIGLHQEESGVIVADLERTTLSKIRSQMPVAATRRARSRPLQ